MVKKIIALQEFLPLRETAALQHKKIVLTNGCFDLLHLGHIRYLQQAKALGDILVIGLNSDSSVQTIKGPSRPIMPGRERAEILAALEAVDYVIVFDEPTAEALVRAVKPDVYVKGGDYKPGGKSLPEAEIVESYGGKVAILPFVEGLSTTNIIETILQRYQKHNSE